MKLHDFPKLGAAAVILCSLLCLVFFAQTTSKPGGGGGGVVTGTPVSYSTIRTVGITDPKAPVVFEDANDKTALSNFKHHAGTAAKDYLRSAFGWRRNS
jgi:hypothetical protein